MIPTCYQEREEGLSPEEVTSVTRRRHRLAVLVCPVKLCMTIPFRSMLPVGRGS
jgi:hypothetical protein